MKDIENYNESVIIRKHNASDNEKLYKYLSGLSEESKKRFGPHPFNREAIDEFYSAGNPYTAYIAEDTATFEIIAYAIIKKGLIQEDMLRLNSLGIQTDEDTDCTFAPSVADKWQSRGLGDKLFRFILEDLKNKNYRRIILWGGVQSTNDRAVNYYKKNNFIKVGEFEHNGNNFDMIKDLD